MKKQAPINYFKNLDGLRFLAAFAVIMGHCQHVIHAYQGYSPYEPFANKLASFGVDFFFVLSGFLISYLLMQEIDKTGTINIRHFYYRRFLRIWPLYFLVGLTGILTGGFWIKYFDYLSLHNRAYIDYVYNWTDLWRNLGFLGTFSINFQTLLGYQNPVSSLGVGHFWSLGIEEQFYLIWAPALFLFKRHVGIVVVIFLGLGLYFNHLPVSDFNAYYDFHYNFTVNRFWYFGLGAAFAWWIQYVSIKMLRDNFLFFLEKKKETSSPLLAGFPSSTVPKAFGMSLYSIFSPFLSAKILKILVLVIQCCCLIWASNYLFGWTYFHVNAYIVNAIVALLIIAIAVADDSIFSFFFLENKVFKYLGKVSYGIYIFHIFSIYLTYKILKNIGLVERGEAFYILCPLVTTIISVGLAALSYHFFESRFLMLKHKFKPQIEALDKSHKYLILHKLRD